MAEEPPRRSYAIKYVCMYVCMYVTSLKYVIREDTCELNDRTDKARPENLVPDSFRYYLTREKNRGELLLFFKHITENTVD